MSLQAGGWHNLLLFLPIALAVTTPGSAQHSMDNPGHDRLWFTLGAGVGRANPHSPAFSWGLAGGASVTYQPSLLVVGAHAGAVWNPFHGEALATAALLVGVGTHRPKSHASIAVGPAVARGDLRTFTATHEHFATHASVAIQVQVLGLPLSSVGGGLTGFLNLNRRQSFGGILLSVAFGQLR